VKKSPMRSTTVAQADNQICHQLGSWATYSLKL
jgi:hypothetical protein